MSYKLYVNILIVKTLLLLSVQVKTIFIIKTHTETEFANILVNWYKLSCVTINL